MDLGWDCWLALDGDEPAAAAGLFVAEGVGYLGFAATLPEHRGKGGQNALLAARIDQRARQAVTSSSRRPASAATTFPPTRTATSSAPASRRSRCAPTGSGRSGSAA